MRISAALVLVALLPATLTADEVRLRRYQRIDPYAKLDVAWGDKAYTYMDAADTYLSASAPGLNFGAARTLRLQPGADDAILLQFGQLNRAIWRGSKITGAALILHPMPGRFPRGVKIEVRRVQREWRDGGADGAPMYWTATHQASMSSPRGNAIRWNGAKDACAEPSLIASTSAGYDPALNAWRLSGPGLLRDVQQWFERWYTNWGWRIAVADPKTHRHLLEFGSADQLEGAFRPELVITYEPLLDEGTIDRPDLNVTFISRTPRYLRYHDDGVRSYERKRYRDDNAGIMKFPVNADTQKWPDKGQPMTYTATIKNSGAARFTGKARFTWKLNDRVLKQGVADLELAPDMTTTESIQIPWTAELGDIRDEKLWFEIDPVRPTDEITKNNNAQCKYLKAKTWKYWVERTPYEYARQFMTAYGSRSFEDYLKWHEHIWNETYLDKSRFDMLAPDGSTQRITLDDFEVVADGRLGGGIHRLDDKPDFHFDGEWGTEWLKGADLQRAEALANIKNFIRATRVLLEGSLLHEAAHQVLGDFDQYWSNIEPSEPRNPNGKCKVKDGGEFYITRGSMYAWPGLMGGDDTRPNDAYTESTGLYSAHSIIGYNANTRFRNGFYGEWQYDLPRSISVRLLAAGGAPLSAAKVRIWQFSGMQILDKNLVTSGVLAGMDGVLKLPDQDSLEATDVTTLTGHTLLKRNPFGRIDVVGSNTVLLLKIEAHGQTDWRFVRCIDLNKAFHMGYRDAYTMDIATQIAPARLDFSADLARGKAVRVAHGPAEAAALTDGDRKTAWNGGPAPAGAYIQIDLGQPATVGAIRFVQSEGHGQFYQRFKVEGSNDASFRTGVVELTRQFPSTFGLAMTNERDIDSSDPAIRWVTYGCEPVERRFLRVTCLSDSGGTTLSAIEVFGP